MLDFQKANMGKRISAAIFDFILLAVAVIGFAFILNGVFGYDSKTAKLEEYYNSYEQQYNVKFDLTVEEMNDLTEAEKAHYNEVQEIINKDTEFIALYSSMMNLIILIVVFSVLLGFLFLEFLVPLLFKNGQTLGKKIFGIGLMRKDGVKITPVMLFVRTVLGKYTIETMIPVFVIVMIFFGYMGIFGSVIIMAIFFIQLIMVLATKAHTAIHDKMAGTVMVDMQSQLIFDTYEDLLSYKQKLHKDMVEQTES